MLASLAALLALQYPLHNDLVPRADVDAARAWEITTGEPAIIVAIVDTGVDVNHPDLASAIWTNPGEIPGNAIDDDGDGLVDDVHGWDFADGDADVDDSANPHGTLVAGLVAGSQTGLAPGVTLMPIKVFSDSLVDPSFENVAAAGIEYAIAHGAKVIQISWELSGPPGAALTTAFDDAETAGALVVVAAGNDGVNLTVDKRYPVALTNANIVGVAGTDPYDRPVNLPGLFVTNYGVTWVEIAAPTEKNPTLYPGGGTILFSGTSAAAPLVSAAAALAWSVNPALDSAQVRQTIIDGGDRLPQLEGFCLGSGRLDAANTVRLASALSASPPGAVAARVLRADPGEAILFDGHESFGGADLSPLWDFADGSSAAALLAEHAYSTGGDWPATLEVENAAGLTHLARTTVSIPFRGASLPQSIESAHPYPAGTQLVVPVSAPGAAWIRLHFSHVETAGNDALLVFDGRRTGLVSYQGTFDDLTTAPIRGDSAFVYLRGFTGGGDGFSLDRLDAEMQGEADRSPVARTDGPVSVQRGESAMLSAASSYDPDGDALSFTWRPLTAPEGSTAIASTTSGATLSITPDREGSYSFALTASDGTATGSTIAWIVTRAADDPGCQCALAPSPRPRFAGMLLLGALALLAHRRKRS